MSALAPYLLVLLSGLPHDPGLALPLATEAACEAVGEEFKSTFHELYCVDTRTGRTWRIK